VGADLRRALVPALVVLGLIAVVAVAATGSLPGGSNRARTPPNVVLDTVVSLYWIALILGAILLVYGLSQRREVAREYRKRKRSATGVLILLLLLVPLSLYLHRPKLHPPAQPGSPAANGAPPGATPTGTTGHDHAPQFAWLPVLAIALLAGAAILAWHLSSRRRSALDDEGAVTESLADVFDDTLDDLRAEADPRKAVVAAYARLERALATQGVARRESETQEELLTRVLDELDVSQRSVRRLTDLFERAKFSQHRVDVGMKEEAIDALEDVRDELRAAESRRTEDGAGAALPAGAGA
jgi:hypothetical protein